jgi:hypothetical protein
MPTYDDDHDGPALGHAVDEDLPTAEIPPVAPPPDRQTTISTPYGELPAYSMSDDVLPAKPPSRRERREAAVAAAAGVAGAPLPPPLPGEPGDGGDGGSGGGPRPTPSPAGRLLIPLAIAIVCAVALLAAWNHFQSKSSADAAAPGVSTAPTSAPSSIPTAPSTTLPSSAASTPAVVATAPSASAPSGSAPSTSAAAPDTSLDRSVPVVVYNGSSVPGRAAKFAKELEAKGWKVSKVGNWTGAKVDATTAFLGSQWAARRAFKADFPWYTQRFFLPTKAMPDGSLVVILAGDKP